MIQCLETGLRDAFARDARPIVEQFLNNRQLLPDDAPPLASETVYKNRPISVHTLFGPITCKRRYFHHPDSGTGRAPLDLVLDLTEGRTPAVAKLGCVFTQTTTDKEGQPMRDPDSTTYVATMGDCRKSGEQLRAEALRRGLALAQTVIFLGDGAAWIWENARIFFPMAIQILDFHHAVEHLGALARALFGKGDFAAAKQRIRASQLKSTDMCGILDQAAGLLAANPDIPAQRLEDAQREIAYFTNHLERTRYGSFRRQGYFIGSGVVEAGCKTVIGRRLKQSGMFWSESGAENILQLRCLIKSPHFDAAWQARRLILEARQTKKRRWSQAS